MRSSIEGMQIVIAGGSGGLGAVTSRYLAKDGAQLAISYRHNRQRADQLADVAKIVRADLANVEDRAALLESAPKLFGLVIFTGDASRAGSPAEMTNAMIRSHEVNYMGPVLLAREGAERMKAAGSRGAIILVSSMQAVSLFPGSTAYAAQKAALLQAGKILAKEYRGKTDIRVNMVCPGVNRAGMAEASIAAGKYDRCLRDDMIPRFGQAEDVARAVRFFLEPDNYTTGQVLTVDGGLTL